MSASELALIVGVVLCALAFAALAVTLVRTRDTLTELRADIAEMRRDTAELLRDVHSATATATDTMATARADLDRFDRVLGSAEAISEAVGRSRLLARTSLSAPVIKAVGVAAGTSRAVQRFRRGA